VGIWSEKMGRRLTYLTFLLDDSNRIRRLHIARNLSHRPSKVYCYPGKASSRLERVTKTFVIPAKVWIQRLVKRERHWIPAFAGMTNR